MTTTPMRQHQREAHDDRLAPNLLTEEVQHHAGDQRRGVRVANRRSRRDLQPARMAAAIVLPLRSSSFMRSKIRMLASTAMPTDRMKPAMPASVSVTGIELEDRQRDAACTRSARPRRPEPGQAVVHEHEQRRPRAAPSRQRRCSGGPSRRRASRRRCAPPRRRPEPAARRR